MSIIGTDILKAADLLNTGELVAIPTETVYGLAANGFDEKAVAKIFEVKERPHFDPLILHIGTQDDVYNIANKVNEVTKKLIKHFWPGPLTLILPKKDVVPNIVTSGLNTVGIRMPNHNLTSTLLNNLKYPLAAPSANPFGFTSPVTANHVNHQLGEKIEYILDGGRCSIGLESTILKPTDEGVYILREGAITSEKITEIGIEILKEESTSIQAPGMLKSHYSPLGKVILFENIDDLSPIHDNNTRYILWNQRLPLIPLEHQYVLSEQSNTTEAAYHLFNALRKFSQDNIKIIYAQKVPNIGIGKAINDRLTRAAE